MKKQMKNRITGESISRSSASEKGIHDVSVDMSARMAVPAVRWIIFAKSAFFLITKFTIREIKKMPKSTADHTGKYVFIF